MPPEKQKATGKHSRAGWRQDLNNGTSGQAGILKRISFIGFRSRFFIQFNKLGILTILN